MAAAEAERSRRERVPTAQSAAEQEQRLQDKLAKLQQQEAAVRAQAEVESGTRRELQQQMQQVRCWSLAGQKKHAWVKGSHGLLHALADTHRKGY